MDQRSIQVTVAIGFFAVFVSAGIAVMSGHPCMAAGCFVVAAIPLFVVITPWLPFRWRQSFPYALKLWPEIVCAALPAAELLTSDGPFPPPRMWTASATFANRGRIQARDVSARIAVFPWEDASLVDPQRNHLEGLWFAKREEQTTWEGLREERRTTFLHEATFKPNGLPWCLELIVKPQGVESCCYVVDRRQKDDPTPFRNVIEPDPALIGVLLTSEDLPSEGQQFWFALDANGLGEPLLTYLTDAAFGTGMSRKLLIL